MAFDNMSPELLMMMSEMSKGNSNDNTNEFDDAYDADFSEFYDDDDDDSVEFYDDDDDDSAEFYDDDDDDDDSAEFFGRRARQRRRKRRLTRIQRRYKRIAKRAGVSNTTVTSRSGKQVSVKLGRKFVTDKNHNKLVSSVNSRFSANTRDHNAIRRATSANSRRLAKMSRDMKAAQQQAQMSSMMSMMMGPPKIDKITGTQAGAGPTFTVDPTTVTYEKNNLPLMMMMMMSGGFGGKSNNSMMPMMMAMALGD